MIIRFIQDLGKYKVGNIHICRSETDKERARELIKWGYAEEVLSKQQIREIEALDAARRTEVDERRRKDEAARLSLAKKFEELRLENEKLKAETDEKIRLYEEQLTAHAKEVQEKDRRIDEQRDQISFFNSEIKEMRNLELVRREEEKKRKEVEDTEKLMLVNKAEELRREKEKTVQLLEGNVEVLKEQLGKKDEHIEHLDEQLERQDEKIKQLSRELDEIRSLDGIRREEEKRKEEMRSAEKQLLEKKVQELRDKKEKISADFKEKIRVLREQLKEKTAELNKREEQVSSLNGGIKELLEKRFLFEEQQNMNSAYDQTAYRETEPYIPSRSEQVIQDLSKEIIIDENDLDQSELELNGWHGGEATRENTENGERKAGDSPSPLVL